MTRASARRRVSAMAAAALDGAKQRGDVDDCIQDESEADQERLLSAWDQLTQELFNRGKTPARRNGEGNV